jgi:hypothetical protein
MAPKIYAVFYLKYISNPFSLKIVCKVVFVNPDAYYGTRVRVNKSRIVRKIYAVFYLKYISNPFSVDLVQGGFCEPRRVLRYASSGEENSYGAEDLRRNFWFYISMPFSLKIVCKVVFVSPDAYVYTRVWVNKSRIVRKIYAKPSFFAISAVFNSSNLDTPFSCMVTPYSTSASSMVPRRWVIKMNWVFLVIRRTY